MNKFYPQLTDTGQAKTLPPVQLGEDMIWSWLLGGQTQQLSPNGYLVPPADFEKGDALGNFNDIASRVTEAILKRVDEV